LNNITAYKGACAALSAGVAEFIVYQDEGHWYEIKRRTYTTVPICGALKKNGQRCRSKKLHRGKKCRFHGGLSTGARTPEGKQKAIAAMREGYKLWLIKKRANQSRPCVL